MTYLIGVDEAGRGALAGPVCVGAVLYPEDFNWREAFKLVTKKGASRLRDSKQLTAQQRDVLYEYIIAHDRLRHASALVDAKVIDAIGIVNAANEAATIALRGLGIAPTRVRVLLDAGLRVPEIWSQESIVRGDETIPAISFASIVAKVTRDRLMESVSDSYPTHNFAQHKGYGTKEHFIALKRHGLSDIHRRTFLHLMSSWHEDTVNDSAAP